MGLFDFIKDIGHKASKEEDLEGSLRDAVTKAQLNIQNFHLNLDKDVVTLSGIAATQRDLELARLIIGNFKGVAKVNDDALQVVATPASAPSATPAAPLSASRVTAQMVTVKSGDTLSKIAKQYLGNASRYPEIFEANRPMIKDPDEIFPGQILRVPSESPSATV